MTTHKKKARTMYTTFSYLCCYLATDDSKNTQSCSLTFAYSSPLEWGRKSEGSKRKIVCWGKDYSTDKVKTAHARKVNKVLTHYSYSLASQTAD